MNSNSKVLIAVLVAALMISVAVGGVVATNTNSNNGSASDATSDATSDETVSQAVTAPVAVESVGTIINEVCPGDPTEYPVIIDKIGVYNTGRFHDLTTHSNFSGTSEAESRMAMGHHIVELPKNNNDYVYFLSDDTRVAGPSLMVEYVAEGKTLLASVAHDTFLPYSSAPSNFWKIENGFFVKVHPISDINLLNDLRCQLSQKQCELASADYQFKKYVDGVLTEEEYAPIKAQRVQLYSEIDTLQAQIAELLK